MYAIRRSYTTPDGLDRVRKYEDFPMNWTDACEAADALNRGAGLGERFSVYMLD